MLKEAPCLECHLIDDFLKSLSFAQLSERDDRNRSRKEARDMQHSSLMRFCDECGLANDLEALHCASCQHLLQRVPSTNPPPIAPLTLPPPPILEVTADALLLAGKPSMPNEFRTGTILAGRYHIQEEIGRGGYSIVYRAVDLDSSQREVAIKRIPLSALSSRQVIDATQTFNREITMLTSIKWLSRGVPRLYEDFTDAENWYLVMEYIAGETLEEYLQKAPGGYLSEEETLELGIRLTQILHQLHTTANPPVIFRDLKPTNIMRTSDHELFLIDFGIARSFSAGKAKDTIPLGSPGYAAPEQYGRTQTEPRSDIYSLGATLQTLLTGRDPLELRAGERSRNPQSPSRPLRKLLEEMLSSKITQRPRSMSRIETRLRSIQLVKGFRGGAALGSLAITIFLLLLAVWTRDWVLLSLSACLGLVMVFVVDKYVGWFQNKRPSFFLGLATSLVLVGLYFVLLAQWLFR